MRLVIIESPFAGRDKDETEYNLSYLRACLHDSLLKMEAPFASHAIYTQSGVLDDKIPEQRTHGIEAGFAWRKAADATIVYTDLGISRGMQLGIDAANQLAERLVRLGEHVHSVEYRKLEGRWSLPRETINEDTHAWWHGCWLQAGHFLHTKTGRQSTAINEHGLDGGYAPRLDRSEKIIFAMQGDYKEITYRSEELSQGQFLHHVIEGRTIISWWDRTQGDSRGACNSCYIVDGEHTSAQMLKWFPKHFPQQAVQLEKAGVRLVEVFAS